ncbi:MAG: hypothetical protein PVH96_08475 [Gemmatimonadota bacterium]|jgi:hypothetical protein
MKSVTHLLWIPAGAVVGALASFVFGDLIRLPVDVYYLIYFGIIGSFLALYVRTTAFDWRAWISRRVRWGVALGVLGGLVLMQGALARPATPHLSGGALAWAVLYRGFVYGAVDGLLLLAFPWVVVWRSLRAESSGWGRKITAGAASLLAVWTITTTYHLGYEDFRSSMIVQPNIGSTIGAVPTILTANPVASPISHVFLHVTAVIHSPDTELFLPPHRD